MNKKFEFIGEVSAFGLKRIRAKIDIGLSVKAGDLGGWIETESNVALTGNAWVSGNAQVYGNARVYGDAQVSGNAWVYGNAQVYGNGQLFVVGPVGSRGADLTATADEKIGVRISTGCFSGSLAEFRAAVLEKHGANSFHGLMYLGLANLIALKFGKDIES